jgi:hypothetical protein
MEKSGREWLLYLASRPPVAPLAKTLQFSLARGSCREWEWRFCRFGWLYSEVNVLAGILASPSQVASIFEHCDCDDGYGQLRLWLRRVAFIFCACNYYRLPASSSVDCAVFVTWLCFAASAGRLDQDVFRTHSRVSRPGPGRLGQLLTAAVLMGWDHGSGMRLQSKSFWMLMRKTLRCLPCPAMG